MTDTEDPNIATLREALDELRSRRPGCPDPTCGLCKRFNAEDAETDAALARLASALAERDRRIAELEAHNQMLVISGVEVCKALDPRPAPAPGELVAGLQMLRGFAAEAGAPQTPEDEQHRSQFMAVIAAAESWQRLQWRPASEAPCGMLLTTYEADGEQIFVLDEKHAEDDGWDERDDMALPLDALPALNGGDDNG